MVAQKKTGSAKKQLQVKQKMPPKMFEAQEDSDDENDEDLSDMDSDEIDSDLDMEGGSSDEAPAKKSKQEKHVAFQLPKGTPSLAKNEVTPMPRGKQQTPASMKGKGALAEFSGMKNPALKQDSAKKGKNAKSASFLGVEDEDDDDDFEEDDEDEEDDDDDDDDEEDSDDLDSAEEEEIKQKILSLKKGAKTPQKAAEAKQQTPQKAAEAKQQTPAKQKQTPAKNAAGTPKNIQAVKQNDSSKKQSPKRDVSPLKAVDDDERERRRLRDARCLFVKDFAVDVTEQELKSLSADIIAISLPNIVRKKMKKGVKPYAFLEFASEKKAEENLMLLKKKKLRGQLIYVDYSGEKSSTWKKKETTEAPVNPKRLYATGFPTDVEIKDFAAMFPKAIEIRMNTDAEYRSVSIEFATDEDADAAIRANVNSKFSGRQITVLHSTKSSLKRKIHKKKGPSNKRQKTQAVKKQEVEDDSD